MRDWFSGHFALSVGPQLDALESLVNFVKRVLLLRKQTQRKIAVVRVRSGIGLVHAKRRSLAAFSAGAQSSLGYTGHRIHHRIAKLEELLFLLAHEWVQPLFAMIQTQQNRRRFRALSSGFRRTSRRLRATRAPFRARLPRRRLATPSLLGANLADW